MKRLAIALFVLVTLSACIGDLPDDPPNDVDPPVIPPTEVEVDYADGAWNYAVEVDVPTPCHGVDVQELVAESYPGQVSVILTVTEPSGNEACPQVVDRTSVEGSVQASEYASMTITFEDEVIYSHEARTPPELMPPPKCTAEYDPVCGQPPMPPCPPGMACPDVMPQPRTYGNGCEMLRDGATLLYEGECRNDPLVS
jgi:hypothetical protein